MILKKCDICGKHEGLVSLDEKGNRYKTIIKQSPTLIQTRNEKGESYNVYITVAVEKETDAKKMDKIYDKMLQQDLISQIFNSTKLNNMMKGNNLGKDEGDPQIEFLKIKLDNPHPFICEECKVRFMRQLLEVENS